MFGVLLRLNCSWSHFDSTDWSVKGFVDVFLTPLPNTMLLYFDLLVGWAVWLLTSLFLLDFPAFSPIDICMADCYLGLCAYN